jgi:hypothetical protein
MVPVRIQEKGPTVSPETGKMRRRIRTQDFHRAEGFAHEKLWPKGAAVRRMVLANLVDSLR